MDQLSLRGATSAASRRRAAVSAVYVCAAGGGGGAGGPVRPTTADELSRQTARCGTGDEHRRPVLPQATPVTPALPQVAARHRRSIPAAVVPSRRGDTSALQPVRPTAAAAAPTAARLTSSGKTRVILLHPAVARSDRSTFRERIYRSVVVDEDK